MCGDMLGLIWRSRDRESPRKTNRLSVAQARERGFIYKCVYSVQFPSSYSVHALLRPVLDSRHNGIDAIQSKDTGQKANGRRQACRRSARNSDLRAQLRGARTFAARKAPARLSGVQEDLEGEIQTLLCNGPCSISPKSCPAGITRRSRRKDEANS